MNMQGPYFELVPVCLAVIAGCWLLSVVTREYSWVDRIWSVAPPAYLWAMAFRLGFADARLNLMAVLATLWGARLTYNFARKGGYRRGGEDYRWAVLRERLGPVWFQVFNATFIAPYQNVLLFLLVAPAQVAVQAGTPLGVGDGMLAALFLAALGLETVADQQQWRFHQEKAARQQRGESGPRFCTTGLFRYSRHPNFFFEVTQWWLMYGFAVTATGQPLHWALIAPVLLTSLFVGSTGFTERISKSKYPEYGDYQRTTSALVPLPPRAR